MRDRITLKRKMILGGITAVFIPFFVAGIIIYIMLSRSLIELHNEKSVHIAQEISARIDAMLMQEVRLVSAIAADPDVVEASKTGDYRLAQTELEAIHKRIGRQYFTIFLTDRFGIARADAVFNQQIGLDLSDRKYFMTAKQGKAGVSGPMMPRGTATSGTPIVVACAPIQKHKDFCGIVAIAFNTDLLISILSQGNHGKTGFTYLTDANGLVLVHPQKKLMLKWQLPDQAGTKGIGKILKRSRSGSAPYPFEGSEQIVSRSGLNLIDWIAVFSQDKAEIMAPVNKIISAIFISGIIFLGVTIAIIIVFSSRFSTPLQKIIEMMKQVTQYSNEIILQIGVDRKIVFANPAFEKITGLKARHIIGTEPDLNTARDIPAKAIWDSLEAGILWSGRVALKRSNPDGTVTLDVMLVPLRDDNGNIQGYIEIGRDITTELMFEKRLQQTQKLEAIGTLAGGIAHDFNNILSGIFGYAELSLMKHPDAEEIDMRTEKNIKEILKASERARDLVSQILTFSRQTDFELRRLLPQSVLKEASKLFRATTPATISIEVKINCDSSIMADPTQLHQVIMNLFTNAVYAIGEKSGTIRLELEDFLVDEEFTRLHPGIQPGKHIILRVSDTGSGIDPKTLDHIFEPFFTTKPHGEGTGLGLSVVHGIVKKLNGIITTYSELGAGTTFNVIIPSVDTAVSEHHQDNSVIQKGTERIAVVDDEPAITASTQSILTNLGYRVTAFTDSAKALTSIKTNPNNFDMLITDYAMPQITGLEIARHLQEAEINMPMIIMSGFFSKDMEKSARNAGISELITKPINTHQLTDAIHRVLKYKAV